MIGSGGGAPFRGFYCCSTGRERALFCLFQIQNFKRIKKKIQKNISHKNVISRGVRVEHFFGSGRVISIFFGRVTGNFGYPFGYPKVFGHLNIFEYLKVLGYLNIRGRDGYAIDSSTRSCGRVPEFRTPLAIREIPRLKKNTE